MALSLFTHTKMQIQRLLYGNYGTSRADLLQFLPRNPVPSGAHDFIIPVFMMILVYTEYKARYRLQLLYTLFKQSPRFCSSQRPISSVFPGGLGLAPWSRFPYSDVGSR